MLYYGNPLNAFREERGERRDTKCVSGGERREERHYTVAIYYGGPQ